MSKPIDERPLVEADSSEEITATVHTDGGALQIGLVDGASADVDIHIDERVDPDMDYVTDVETEVTGQTSGYNNLWQLDLRDIHQIRVRIVNNDVDESIEAQVVLRTDGG